MADHNTHQPGQARANGPTVADTLTADRVAPPQALLDSRYDFLGDDNIPCSRYTSREFFDREMRDVWSRTWQWACREEHVQDIGDTYVYDIGPYSVIVVRSGEDTIQPVRVRGIAQGLPALSTAGPGISMAGSTLFLRPGISLTSAQIRMAWSRWAASAGAVLFLSISTPQRSL